MKRLAVTALSLSLITPVFAQSNEAGASSASDQDSQAIRIVRKGTQPSRQGPRRAYGKEGWD